MPSRFPAPWTVHRLGGSYSVRDASGYDLLYVYFVDHPPLGTGRDHLTSDQARRIASNIAKLPELLGKGGTG